MIRDTFSILFYPKNSKIRANDEAPIYCRITIRGKRAEFSTKRYINPEYWDSENNVVDVPNDRKASKAINNYLEIIDKKLYNLQAAFIEKDEIVTASQLKNAFLGVDDNSKTLIEVFKYHNGRMKELIDVEFEEGTHKRYETTLDHVMNFIEKKYQKDDVPLKKLNFSFINDFEFYLRTARACNNNTTIKYIRNLRKVIFLAIKKGWLSVDPFALFDGKVKDVKRNFLNKEELETIENKEFSIARLAEIRDIFIFCCYTGYAYAEVSRLSKEHLVTGLDGNKWVYLERKKTDTTENVPLLPKALEILAKYGDHPICKKSNKLLPVKSNQKMNAYLKEIQELCGVTKNLTTHLARHTFATTVTLTNGVPIETVSKMLGHKNIKTTQIYSKVVQAKVSQDMTLLTQKLQGAKEKKEAV